MYQAWALFSTGTIFVITTENPFPTELGPLERMISYVGLLAMGWFFWKRETSRTDKAFDDLKAENQMLKRDIKELEKDIRALLENRSNNPDARRQSDITKLKEERDD